ncbi:diguanylate cyclase [Candidatus Fermentibacteria bacterium]|nr:diguanylate cyclase [Candidatus Fermentibacteria bacterium]
MNEEAITGLPYDKQLLDNLFEGAYVLDRDRKVMYWNESAERITGHKSSETVGTVCSNNLLMHLDSEGNSLCESNCPAEEAMSTGQVGRSKMYLRHRNGHRVPVAVISVPLFKDDRVCGVIEFFREDLALHALRERLRDLQEVALVDTLTGVGNRRYVEEILKQRAAEKERYGRKYGVVFMDIDSFRKVNDSFGHDAGDRVLRTVARSLMGTVRPFDAVSRWGGEEFLIVLQNIEKDQIGKVTERIKKIVEASSTVYEDQPIKVKISAGATAARPGEDPDTVVERAHSLLFSAKQKGKDRVEVS